MEDRTFIERAGGRFESAAIPDVITSGWLAWQCDQLERTLRAQFKRRALPDEDEAEIATLKERGGGLRLWSRLKHLWWKHEESLVRADTSAEKDRAAVQLMTREPVRTWIAGRWVEVTFRGQRALIHLARHDLARRNNELDLDRVAELAADVLERRDAGAMSRTAARRRLRWLERIHHAIHDELLRHTRVILANALTPDGAAVEPDAAPAWLNEHAQWWERVTPEDEQLLFLALYDAGPGRLARMGAPPEDERDDERDGRAWREDFGFWSLYAYFCREHGLTPAEMADQEVAQFLTMMRIGQPYFPPPKQRRSEVH